MKILVESFKRLYHQDKVTDADLQTRVTKGTITQEEYTYIVGDAHDN